MCEVLLPTRVPDRTLGWIRPRAPAAIALTPIRASLARLAPRRPTATTLSSALKTPSHDKTLGSRLLAAGVRRWFAPNEDGPNALPVTWLAVGMPEVPPTSSSTPSSARGEWQLRTIKPLGTRATPNRSGT